MKLVTFQVSTPIGPVERIGALVGEERVIDLSAGYALYLDRVEGETRPYALAEARVPSKMITFLEGGKKSLEAARNAVDYVTTVLQEGASLGLNGEKIAYSRTEIRLLAPVPRPNTVTDFSCFEDHWKDSFQRMGRPLPEALYKIPAGFVAHPDIVVGPDEDIFWPNFGEVRLDYECELGIYIGKKGKDIPVEAASEYIAGYTLFNDVSERIILRQEISIGGVIKGKNFDHAKIMGPCLVTADEVDFKNIKVAVRLNGEFQVEGSAKTMYWSWEQLIAHASKTMTLYPGDFFGSGAVGLCCGGSTGRTLKPGDCLEFEATGIGILRNRVVGTPSH